MEVENGEDGRPVLGAGHETGVLVVLDAGSCNIKLRTRLKGSHPDQGGSRGQSLRGLRSG